MADVNQRGFMLTGPAPRKGWSSLRGIFRFTEPGLKVLVAGFKRSGDRREDYECRFTFRVDPLELGAAALSALVGCDDVQFAWKGRADEDEVPWVLRGYWFRRPPGPGLLRRIEELEAYLEGGAPQSGMGKAKDDLSAIERAVERKDAVYALSLESMSMEGEAVRFPFLLQSASLLGAFVHCREIALARGGVCLVGGLRVVVSEEGVGLAAGSSRALKLASDQRLMLGMGLQKALEAGRAVSARRRVEAGKDSHPRCPHHGFRGLR